MGYPESKEEHANRLRQTRIAFMKGEDNQAAFCRITGIDPNRWSNAEHGYNFLGKQDQILLYRTTGVDSNWILHGSKVLLSKDFLTELAKVPPKEEKPRSRPRRVKRA